MIGKRMLKAMNEQIKNELESYYIYLSMVAYFHSHNLDGMAHWMRCQAHEEMIHAMKFSATSSYSFFNCIARPTVPFIFFGFCSGVPNPLIQVIFQCSSPVRKARSLQS